jgi:hypothetical protein
VVIFAIKVGCGSICCTWKVVWWIYNYGFPNISSTSLWKKSKKFFWLKFCPGKLYPETWVNQWKFIHKNTFKNIGFNMLQEGSVCTLVRHIICQFCFLFPCRFTLPLSKDIKRFHDRLMRLCVCGLFCGKCVEHFVTFIWKAPMIDPQLIWKKKDSANRSLNVQTRQKKGVYCSLSLFN